ncbi:MAG: hypothetical protein M1824_005521 [Vezdaea acicularis]|nr:MAG: hypothetical protein M1824_005521 [Vezdaea acicularis]
MATVTQERLLLEQEFLPAPGSAGAKKIVRSIGIDRNIYEKYYNERIHSNLLSPPRTTFSPTPTLFSQDPWRSPSATNADWTEHDANRLSVVLAMARKQGDLEFVPKSSLVCHTIPEIKAAVDDICNAIIAGNKDRRRIAEVRKSRAGIAKEERLRRTRKIVEEGHRFIGMNPLNSKRSLNERRRTSSDEDGSGAGMEAPSVVKKKQLNRESQIIVRRWMARHDQTRKTDCGIYGEDPGKNWEELFWELGYRGRVPPDVDAKYRTYVRNEGNRLEAKGVFVRAEVPDGEGRLKAKEKRIWKSWTKLWEEKGWDGNTNPPQLTVEGVKVSIHPAIRLMSYSERHALVKWILDVGECPPTTSSDGANQKRTVLDAFHEDRIASDCLLSLSSSATSEKRRRIVIPTSRVPQRSR